MQAPVWIHPGQADKTVTVHLGYGRTRAGRVGNGAGFNAYALRTAGAPWSGTGAALQATGQTQLLASTQLHRPMNWVKDETAAAAERELVKVNTLAGFLKDPEFAKEKPHGYEHEPAPGDSLYPNYKYDGYAWGMVINLNACTGCSGCVTACQAENNIPVVGRDQVAMSREMHWIDVDRYYHGDLDDPDGPAPAPALHALRERPVRGGLPRGGDGARRRGDQQHGLQPLRRHPLLRQ